jgi:type II secretory pathway pseudopilin PulG
MRQIRRTDERGMVAIIVTLVMMLVITLIVLGFAQVTRRNQREALDSQLALQAYYAAETGVNDIANGLVTGSPPNRIDCSTFAYNGQTLPRTLKPNPSDVLHPEVANTCLLIDAEPTKLIADDSPDSTGSVMWNVKTLAGINLASLDLSWEKDPGGSGSCSLPYTSYPPAGPGEWDCDHALLRMDIVRTSDVNAHLNAATDPDAARKLAAATATVYLHPSDTATPVSIDNFTSNVTGYQGGCKVNASPPAGTPSCSAHITFSTGNSQSNDYYVRLTTLYADAKKVVLSGTDISGGVPRFKDGQIVVDSTGRAQDQVKRISVRIPLSKASSDNPVFGLQGAGGVCKDILITGGVSYKNNACTALIVPTP